MNYLPISGLPMIEEDEATPEIAQLYEETKRALGIPYVLNMSKAVAISPSALAACTQMFSTFFSNLTLPQALVAMISYSIPTAKNCRYCSANRGLYCRSLGIDEEMLEKLAKDLGNVNPKRIRIIIQFALQCALNPQELMAEDYNKVRDQGVTDEELVEIIFIAGVANMIDTLADALKIDVDTMVAQVLEQ